MGGKDNKRKKGITSRFTEMNLSLESNEPSAAASAHSKISRGCLFGAPSPRPHNNVR